MLCYTLKLEDGEQQMETWKVATFLNTSVEGDCNNH